MTITFKLGFCLAAFFNNANKTSVAMVLSWASSSMITEYRFIFGSFNASRSNIPSVMYLITVFSLVTSSNLMV